MISRYSLALPLVLSLAIHAVLLGVGEVISWRTGGGESRKPPPVEYQLDASAQGTAPGKTGGTDSENGSGRDDHISLETPDPAYRPYFDILRKRIGRQWQEPRVGGDGPKTGALKLEFTLGRKGDLKSVEVAESSGVKNFDFAAVKAVKTAAPFAAIPPEIPGKELRIRAVFVYD